MRIIFMGTPLFAADILEELAQQQEIVAVYTRPDAISGRGTKPEPSPVKSIALNLDIPVFTPKTLRDKDVQNELASLHPDVIVVAAYGAILPKEVLTIPTFGCFNVHASLLPRWRGAAPIERAILAGDTEVGVCIMDMEEGLDTGDYCISRSIEVRNQNAEALTAELAELGASALLVALAHVEAGKLNWVKQNEDDVTYAAKINKGELNITEDDTTVTALRKIQASSKAHPSRLVINHKSVTLLAAQAALAPDIPTLGPGLVGMAAKKVYLGLPDGVIELLTVKPDGKQAMDAKAFAAGIQGIKNTPAPWESMHD